MNLEYMEHQGEYNFDLFTFNNSTQAYVAPTVRAWGWPMATLFVAYVMWQINCSTIAILKIKWARNTEGENSIFKIKISYFSSLLQHIGTNNAYSNII